MRAVTKKNQIGLDKPINISYEEDKKITTGQHMLLADFEQNYDG